MERDPLTPIRQASLPERPSCASKPLKRGADPSKIARKRPSEHYSNLIPPPRVLSGLEAVLPGATERILTLVEHQVAAHIQRDMDIRRRDDRFRLWGMGLGIGVILLLFLCALWALHMDKDGFAAVLFGTGALGIVTAFLRLIISLSYPVERKHLLPPTPGKHRVRASKMIP
jgi:uncharacterized membrane protein